MRRASTRAANSAHDEMKRGVHILASIAFTAPWVGISGTLLGIVYSFRGVDGEKSSIFAWIMDSLADALAPTALGLLVALLAFWGHRYCLSRLSRFQAEMDWASNHLVTEVAKRFGHLLH